jgi:MFS family permease
MADLTAPPAPARQRSPLLINRRYANLWLGQSISGIGDFVFATTLVLWIATRIGAGDTWAPAAVSGVLFATSIPTLLVGPVAGVFADRWNQRRTMLLMDALRAVLIFLPIPLTGLAPVPGVGSLTPPVPVILGIIYATVAAQTACAMFFNPSRTTIIRDVVAEPQRQRAAALSQTTQNLAIILGPLLAALLVSHVGIAPALLADSLSFAVSFVAVAAVRWVPESRSASDPVPSFVAEFGEGITFFFTNRVLRTGLIAMSIVMLGGGALNALDVFFVTENLHVAAPQLGTLDGVYGAGAVVGAVLMAAFSRRIQPAQVFWLSLLLLGVLLVVYSRMSVFTVAAAVLFLAGFPQAGLSASLSPLVLHVTPREIVGRVSAIFGPAISLVSMISAGIAGVLDSTALRHLSATVAGLHFGPVDTIFFASGLLICAGGVYAFLNLRNVRLQTE